MTGDGARAARPAAAQERGSPALIALMVWLAVRLPRPLLRGLLYPIAFYFYCTSAATRAHSRRFLARALGRRPTPQDSFRQLLAFATTLLDRARVLGGARSGIEVLLHGEQQVFELLATRGCVLVTAHVGAFDVMRASARGDAVDVRIVMDRDQGARVGALLERLDPTLAARIIHAPSGGSASGPALALAVKQAVDARALVGIMADRALPGSRHLTLPVLDAPVALPLAPYLLATVLRVPVLVGFSVLEGDNRYRVSFVRLDEDGELPPLPAGRDARVAELARRFAAQLTDVARRYPYNWFNFHDYFGDLLPHDSGPVDSATISGHATARDRRGDADDGAGPRPGGTPRGTAG
jgi:predicted LPLAT superfamily acyltransferase